MTAYQLVHTAVFEDCVESYRGNNRVSGALGQAVLELMRKPFENPRLQTHRVDRAQGRTFTSYVGNQGHRVIWRLVDKAIVLLLFGEHDAVYRRAENLRIETDPVTGLPEVHDADPARDDVGPYREKRQQVGRLFMAWRDDELAGLGLEPHEVAIVRGIDTEPELMELEAHMRPEAHEIALSLFLYGLDGEPADEVDQGHDLEPEPAEPADEDERALAEAINRPEAHAEFLPVEPEFMAEIISRPIEDWMIFLHPDQVALVERRFDGPARVRGASGTGKTVVALHRAARAARDGDRVLFTTFITSLPLVLEQLFARLAPDVADRVEFVHLHGWARELLDVNGDGPTLDQQLVDNAWSNAWRRIDDRSVKKLGSAYVREEVTSVIRARGIQSEADYLALHRVGRRVPLSDRQREGVWEAAEAYATALRRLGTIDHGDLLRLAAERVAEGDAPYDVVIVDEAQDLDAAGVRLAAALCGGPEGRLLLVGDGQQSVYPGSWTFGEVGLEVRGRSAVLRTNYRNTREVLDVALRLIADRDFVDGDETAEAGQRDIEVLRTGEPPTVTAYDSEDEHDAALVAHVADLLAQPHVHAGDVLVTASDNRIVDHLRGVVGEAGIETMDLRSYRGEVDDRVKFGTCLRAKGLEFKYVVVGRLDVAADRVERAGQDGADLLLRQLFVAMGRARDGLWVGSVDPDGGDPLAMNAAGPEAEQASAGN